jgi:hypothetical protein
MRPVPDEDMLDVIGCEIEERPAGAPGLDALAPHLRSVQREAGAVTIGFHPEARETLIAFVDAERHCCAGTGWTVREAPGLALRIEDRAAALDVFEGMFKQAHIDGSR